MSNPAFKVYYDDDGPLTSLDLGEGLSALEETPIPSRTVTTGSDGRGWSSLTEFGYRVDITLRKFGTPAAVALERKLQALANHLNRGGLCGFSVDDAKTWGSILPTAPRAGTSSFVVAGNAFTAWSGAGTVVAGDEVVLETVYPEARRDILPVTSLSGSTLTVSESLRMTMRYQPVIRSRNFWPVLFADPADGDMAVDPVRTVGYAYDFVISLRYSPSLAYQLISGGTLPGIPGRGIGGAINPLGAQGLRPTTASAGSMKGHTIESMIHPRMNGRWR